MANAISSRELFEKLKDALGLPDGVTYVGIELRHDDAVRITVSRFMGKAEAVEFVSALTQYKLVETGSE